MYTFQELAKLKNDLVARFGISTTDAARVVGYCSQNNIEFTPAALGPVFSDLGIDPGEPVPTVPAKIAPQRKKSTQERPTKEKKVDTSPADVPQCIQDINAPHNETIIDTLPQALPDTPEADPDDFTNKLPPGLYEEIAATIENYCRQHKVQDDKKLHPAQWKAICIRLGQSFKKRQLLRDLSRIKEGGFRYDGEKVAALLSLYECVCSDYKQVPFVYNFILFSGVSRQYFADYGERLTSGRFNIRQKAYDIQKAGLIDAVTGGGSATVGNIFLSKALAGLQETSTVVHVSASPSVNLAELPKLDQLPG